MQIEEQQEVAGYEGNPFGAPDTPELAPPARQSDAHRVKVDGVSLVNSEYGSKLRIATTSQDMGITINHDLWLPEGYVENPKVDPTTLPTSENFIEDQQGKYAKDIHNSKKTATLDNYLSYAYAQGRTEFGALAQASTIEAVAEALNGVLAGVELIVVRKPGKKNPDFLNISSTKPIEAASDVKFLNRLAKADVAVRWA